MKKTVLSIATAVAFTFSSPFVGVSQAKKGNGTHHHHHAKKKHSHAKKHSHSKGKHAHKHHSFRAYSNVRKALSADNLKAAKMAAKHLQMDARKAAKKFKGKNRKTMRAIAKAAANIQKAKTIGAARMAFGQVSKNLIAFLAKNPKFAKGTTAYFCPMAKGFKKWVQFSTAMANPYMGKKMLQCGSKAKIN